MSTEGGTRAVIAAMIANGGIALTKFGAYAITGSSSMLSEAIHSVADTGNQALLLIGGKRSLEAPDAEHQFGYGRRRYVYAFVVAIILFMLGGMFSLYEGWHKISHPEELTMVWVAYAVLFIAIGLESWSFRTAFREANKSRGTRSLKAYIQDTRQPELPGRAARGPRRAARPGAGALRHHDGGRHRRCPLGRRRLAGDRHAAAVHRRVPGLRGVRAAGRGVRAARAGVGHQGRAHAQPGVDSIIHMRTLHTGPDELLVAVKIGVRRDLPASELAVIDRRGGAAGPRGGPDGEVDLRRARHRAGAG